MNVEMPSPVGVRASVESRRPASVESQRPASVASVESQRLSSEHTVDPELGKGMGSPREASSTSTVKTPTSVQWQVLIVTLSNLWLVVEGSGSALTLPSPAPRSTTPSP